jgi:hypothetical protein
LEDQVVPRTRSTRRSRGIAYLLGRLTFANVVAVLALFVALGGSSYAAIKVGSEQIANNSVSSEDLRNNDVRGPDIAKDTVRGTDVRDDDLRGRDVRDDTISGSDVKESTLGMVPSAADALTLAGEAPSAFLGSDKQTRTGLIKLTHGETRTVAASGPFTWKAQCTDDGGGSTRLTVTLKTTEADSFAGSFGGGPGQASPGSPATVFDASDSNPVYTIGFPLSAVAPNGATPTGLAFVGLHVAGADCVINGILWK